MTSFLLKIIGIITMLCDHTGDAILGSFSILNLIGRIAFPLFAFQISQSYIHTKNLIRFMFRLLIFALIAQLPFSLFLSTFTSDLYYSVQVFSVSFNIYSLNIGFTMLLALLAILAYDKISNKPLGILTSLLIVIIAQILNVDYGAFGVLLILIFYIFRTQPSYAKKKNTFIKVLMNIAFLIVVFTYYFIRYLQAPNISIIEFYLPLVLFTYISLLFINFYNGKQGPKVKYLFYIFYPVHLLLLYFINYMLFN